MEIRNTKIDGLGTSSVFEKKKNVEQQEENNNNDKKEKRQRSLLIKQKRKKHDRFENRYAIRVHNSGTEVFNLSIS